MCVTLSLQNLIKIDLSYQLIMNTHIFICIYIIFYLGMPPSMCYRFHHKIKLLSLVLSHSLSLYAHTRAHTQQQNGNSVVDKSPRGRQWSSASEWASRQAGGAATDECAQLLDGRALLKIDTIKYK